MHTAADLCPVQNNLPEVSLCACVLKCKASCLHVACSVVLMCCERAISCVPVLPQNPSDQTSPGEVEAFAAWKQLACFRRARDVSRLNARTSLSVDLGCVCTVVHKDVTDLAISKAEIKQMVVNIHLYNRLARVLVRSFSLIKLGFQV